MAALVIGGLGGIVAGLLQSRGVGLQLSTSAGVMLACGSVLASIGIATPFSAFPGVGGAEPVAHLMDHCLNDRGPHRGGWR
jgi:hypothetical protein